MLAQHVPGHYRIFVGAGRALWAGISPYGTDYGTGVGFWFYSPTCGMFFFGPFALLPEKLGLFVYMALSWTLFVIGAKQFITALLGNNPQKTSTSHLLNFFWLGISPQMFTGILTSKLEISMVGLLFLCASWLLAEKRLPLAAFVLAMLLNWKFQPLPTIGLVLIVWLLLRRSFFFIIWIVAASLFWLVLPLAFKSAGFILSVYQQWNSSLSSFVRTAWLDFDNIFSFLHNALGLRFSFGAFQVISGVIGTLLALALGYWTFERRKKTNVRLILGEGVGLGMALGGAFTVAFSPLSQNNSYILYAPTLLLALLSVGGSSGIWKRSLEVVLGSTWLVMTFAYSDAVPASFRAELRHISVKPVACFSLAIFLLAYFHFCRERRTLLGWS